MKLSVQPEQATQGARLVVVDEHGDILLTTFDNTEQSRTLAYLASVASEMLEVLKVIRDDMERLGIHRNYDATRGEGIGGAFREVEDAIAKAEGRPHG